MNSTCVQHAIGGKFIFKGSMMAVVAGMLLLACKKNGSLPRPSNDPVVKNVQTWFNETVVGAEQARLALPYDQLPKYSMERRMARWSQLNGLADWEHALVKNVGTKKLTVVPILATNTPFKDAAIEAGRVLAFSSDVRQVEFDMIEVIGKKGVPLAMPLQEIALRSMEHRLTKATVSLPDLNAAVLTYDRNYHLNASDVYESGVRKPYKVVLGNRRAITNPTMLNPMLRTTTCMQCTNWYLVQYTYWEDTGAIVDYNVLREWQECSGDLPDPSYGDVYQDAATDDCSKTATESLSNMVANTSTTSELAQVSVASETATLRMKNYRWKALKSLTWDIYSHEVGTHVKATTAEGFPQWQWKSLEHVRLEMNGMPIGGTVEYDLISARSTLGLFNASMEVVMGVKYGTNCLGVPLSRYENYTTSIYFNVND